MKSSTGKVLGRFRGVIGVLAITLVGVAIVGAAEHPSHTATSKPPARVIARLSAIAHNVASVNGDKHPAAIVAVATAGGPALAAATPGGTEPGVAHVPVYVITIKGNFKGYGFRHPPGTPLPTGRFIDVVVNARTFWVMAMSLNAEPTRIGKLGRQFALR